MNSNIFLRTAAFIGDFCDIKNFTTRDSSCPVPNITTSIEFTSKDIESLAKVKELNHPDSERFLLILTNNLSPSKGDLGEYGFTFTNISSIITGLEKLPDGEVKSAITSLIETKEDSLAQLEGEELIAGWKSIFESVQNYLEGKYGKPREIDPEKEKMVAQVTHKDPLDTYKNEVNGCLRKGTCCIKCDHLINCPVPEHICNRVQKWALDTRTELAESEGYDEASDMPGFDPENIKFDLEEIPWEYKNMIVKESANPEKYRQLREKDPVKYDYYRKIDERKIQEEKKEVNPYVQKMDELKLEEIFPGILEWYRANWNWLLTLKDKKVPIMDASGNPTGKYYTFSDADWNIKAPEVRQLLANKYPSPSKEELIQHIETSIKGKGLHGEKKVSAEEVYTQMMALPGLEGLGDFFKDIYKEKEHLTGPAPKMEE